MKGVLSLRNGQDLPYSTVRQGNDSSVLGLTCREREIGSRNGPGTSLD